MYIVIHLRSFIQLPVDGINEHAAGNHLSRYSPQAHRLPVAIKILVARCYVEYYCSVMHCNITFLLNTPGVYV